MTTLTWVLESSVFPERYRLLREAIARAGDVFVEWRDDWWFDGVPSKIPGEQAIFHGALGTAARVDAELGWSPGAFCPVEAFNCSSWYEQAASWLIHERWHVLAANELVERAASVAEELGSPDRLFVRPDSPLKPFAGRVVDVEGLTLDGLDHGYYYEDESLPVVAAPVREVGDEWRFVIVDGEVIAGSGYEAATRTAKAEALDTAPARVAAEIAAGLATPAPVYVLDVCAIGDDFRLLELNPFGGADLYACDEDAIVREIGAWAHRTGRS